jgi:hypothetical protein
MATNVNVQTGISRKEVVENCDMLVEPVDECDTSASCDIKKTDEEDIPPQQICK